MGITLPIGTIVRITKFGSVTGCLGWAIVSETLYTKPYITFLIWDEQLDEELGPFTSPSQLIDWPLDSTDTFTAPADEQVPDEVWVALARWRLE